MSKFKAGDKVITKFGDVYPVVYVEGIDVCLRTEDGLQVERENRLTKKRTPEDVARDIVEPLFSANTVYGRRTDFFYETSITADKLRARIADAIREARG